MQQFVEKKAWPEALEKASQVADSVTEMQQFVEKKAWPETFEKFSQIADSVSQVSDSVSEAADSVSKNVEEVSITAIEIMHISINSLGLLLMILAAILCRWIISSNQSGGKYAFSFVIFYALYIFCIFLAIHFAYDLLIDLNLVPWQENYQLISAVALMLPVLEVLYSIFCKLIIITYVHTHTYKPWFKHDLQSRYKGH